MLNVAWFWIFYQGRDGSKNRVLKDKETDFLQVSSYMKNLIMYSEMIFKNEVIV